MTYEARNVRIADEYVNSDRTLRDIGEEYGMTHERVRQIVNEVYPGYTRLPKWRQNIDLVWKEAQEAISYPDLAERTGLTARILQNWYQLHPEFEGLSELLKTNRRNRTHKTCSACKRNLPLSSFSTHRARCVDCNRDMTRQYTKALPLLEEPVVEEKVCTGCLRNLPVSEYYKSRRSTTGIQQYCKECHTRLGKGETVKEVQESHGYTYRRTRRR